ncbi:hypothetical protein STAS_32194 [Striga asiatica]|uniref:Uncharacterized protein n=1 Tax=Striga asiatica TaxID=4170 RepID=A0A5A7RBC4_STRAF|nr:hypothetical protein STAS_32194 [Striga asiatica]
MKREKMRRALALLAAVLICSSLPAFPASDEPSGSSIYEVLKSHGLPMGLLPKGVRNFSYDNSGKFQVHLDRACNAKFEDELHYDMNVSGTIRYGQIDGLSGISARDLFLWLPVIEIRVDIPSSGLIYFNVSVVSKQFSLSSFETPRDCLAVPGPGSDLQAGPGIAESASKDFLGFWSNTYETCLIASDFGCIVLAPENLNLSVSIVFKIFTHMIERADLMFFLSDSVGEAQIQDLRRDSALEDLISLCSGFCARELHFIVMMSPQSSHAKILSNNAKSCGPLQRVGREDREISSGTSSLLTFFCFDYSECYDLLLQDEGSDAIFLI